MTDRLLINEVPRNHGAVVQIVVSSKRMEAFQKRWQDVLERSLARFEIFPGKNEAEADVELDKQMVIEVAKSLFAKREIPDVLKSTLTENQYQRWLRARASGKGVIVRKPDVKVDLQAHIR